MACKDEREVSTIFIPDAFIKSIDVDLPRGNIFYADNPQWGVKEGPTTYTLSFKTMEDVIFENPIRVGNGPYEVVILIREKQ